VLRVETTRLTEPSAVAQWTVRHYITSPLRQFRNVGFLRPTRRLLLIIIIARARGHVVGSVFTGLVERETRPRNDDGTGNVHATLPCRIASAPRDGVGVVSAEGKCARPSITTVSGARKLRRRTVFTRSFRFNARANKFYPVSPVQRTCRTDLTCVFDNLNRVENIPTAKSYRRPGRVTEMGM